MSLLILRKWSRLAVFSFVALLSCSVVGGADWPQLLGPTANGVSRETGLLERWPPNGPPLLWEKPIGSGYGAPAVRGNVLVLHHRLGAEEIVAAFAADSGQPLWQYAYPSQFTDPFGYNNGPRASPLLSLNHCYTFGAAGKLLCLDLETGRLVWQRDTAKDWNVPEAFFGVGSSPILEGDRLLVMVGGQTNSGMVAFAATTGKVLWESVGLSNWQGQPKLGWPGDAPVVWSGSDKQASYATPVAATVHGQRQVFCLMRQGLVSLDPQSGAVNFSRWFRARVEESVNAANPVVVNDQVLISSAYYKLGTVLLRVQGDSRSCAEVWRNTNLEAHWTTPIYHDGYLYAFSGRNEPDARFRCLEFATGKLVWDRNEGWPAHSAAQPTVYGRGSFILADGKLIVLGEGGLLGLFKLNSRRDEELSRFQVPQLHYPCWAAPVLAGKRLYLRSEDRLVCLNLAR